MIESVFVYKVCGDICSDNAWCKEIVLNIILKKGEALYAIRIVFVDIFSE